MAAADREAERAASLLASFQRRVGNATSSSVAKAAVASTKSLNAAYRGIDVEALVDAVEKAIAKQRATQ